MSEFTVASVTLHPVNSYSTVMTKHITASAQTWHRKYTVDSTIITPHC